MSSVVRLTTVDPAVALSRPAVVAIVRRRILDGDYAPGQRLIEQRLAQALGSPRSLVREALIELAGAGLVELHPHRGARVRVTEADEVAQTMLMLQLLETHMMREASRRMPDGLRRQTAHASGLMQTASDAQSMRRLLADVSGQFVAARLFTELSDRLTAHRLQPSPTAESQASATIRETRALAQAVCAADDAGIVVAVQALYDVRRTGLR